MKNNTDEIKWLQRRMGDNPNSILFARLAENYLKNNNVDQAIQICDRGLEFHPNYSTGYLILAKCFFQKEEFEHAEKQLKKVLSIDPKYLLAHKMFAELMAQLGWSKTAESSIRKIHQIDPLETHVRSVSPDTQTGKQEHDTPGMSASETESELEINDNSIENLFKSDLNTQETDEEIESLFAGNFEEDVTDSYEPDEQEKAIESGLSDETVDALFEPEGDTSFESFVDEQSRAGESDEYDQEEQYDTIADTKQEQKSDMGSDAFSLGEEDESVFGFAGDSGTTIEQDESAGAEIDTIEADEDAEISGFPGTNEVVEEDNEPADEIDLDTFTKAAKEPDFSPEKYQEQKERYSNILDGIFSPGMDEDERKEMETRSQLEQQEEKPEIPIADEETNDDIFSIPEEEMDDVSDEIMSQYEDESEKENIPDLTPEDMIINGADEAERISIQREDELTEQSTEEPEIPEGFLAFEEDESGEDLETGVVHMQDYDQKDFDEEEEKLGQFLAGLGESDEEEEPEAHKAIYDDILEDTAAATAEQKESQQPEPEETEFPDLTPEQPEVEKKESQAVRTEPEPSTSPKDKFVTPTLGEIYAAQGQYAKAINVFELLQEKQPDNEYYKTKLEYLKKKLDETNN
ncbi:hypothetical protein JXQ31_04595 [candidate division KSB1 bacterium]|nr:hypothetical protein [candidate division KSB1 bacterium]